MKKAILATLILSLTALLALAQAGGGAGDAKKTLESIGQQLGKDTAGLLKESYQQRTAIQMKGEDKGATLAQVAFGPDGKPLVTPISAPPPETGRQKRGVRGAVQKDVKEGVSEEIQGLVKLANGYLMVNQAKMQELLQKAEVSFIPGEGTVKLSVQNFLQPGDKVFRKFDGKTFRQMHTRVETAAGGSPVTIEATYQTLPSGLTYCAQTEISVPAKGLKITLNTTNYQPQ
jgi:hypothetical protein